VSNLRVDDHPEPLAELRRLLRLEQAYRRRNEIVDRVPEGDREAAEREIEAAVAAGLPALDVRLAEAFARLRSGDVPAARAAFRPLLDEEPRWRGFVEFLARHQAPQLGALLDERIDGT
jgi:hypothetical protein